MGRTSPAVKYRYNKKAYDFIQVIAPKGTKDEIKAHAERAGETVSLYMRNATEARMKEDDEKFGSPS